MSKIAVIYWSGTGNTESMAEEITGGIGASAKLFRVEEISVADAAEYDKLALGCPSMGAEVLEESEFEPFFTGLEAMLSGKKVALFGSYGWGDGEWMRDWQERVNASGAQLFEEGLILNETPNDAGLARCRKFGTNFASF